MKPVARRIVELKMKAVSLAAEVRLIRREERKHEKSASWCVRWLSQTGNMKAANRADILQQRKDSARVVDSLRYHRKIELRSEQRSTHLARAYLRGVPYRSVERTCNAPPNWIRVAAIIKSFGGDTVDLSSWIVADK